MGLYALALSILTLIELIEQLGLDKFFITQSPNNRTEPIWLMNCWTARVIMAMVASAIVISVSFMDFDNQRVNYILLLLSIMPPLVAIKSAKMTHLQKHREFVPLAKFEIGASILRTIAPIAIVYFFRNVESLIITNIIVAAIIALASHFLFQLQHRLTLSRSILRDMTSFGSKFLYISGLTTAHNTLDNLIIGFALGSTALGYYSTGYRIAMAPVGFVGSVTSRILTSNYRRAADLGTSYLITQWSIAFRFLAVLNGAIMSCLILASEPLVLTLLGDEWSAAVRVILLAAFISFFRSMAHAIGPILLIKRAISVDAYIKTIEVSVFLCCIVIAYVNGSLELFLIGGIVSYALGLFLRLEWWRRKSKNSLNGEYLAGIMQLAIAFLMMCFSYFVATSLPSSWKLLALLLVLITAIPAVKLVRELIKELDR